MHQNVSKAIEEHRADGADQEDGQDRRAHGDPFNDCDETALRKMNDAAGGAEVFAAKRYPWAD